MNDDQHQTPAGAYLSGSDEIKGGRRRFGVISAAASRSFINASA
jgi:hypothetical protein